MDNLGDITRTRKRYERNAPFYDLMELPMEGLGFAGVRARIHERITGSRALEAGVGTGKNIPYYPDDIQIFAIDISPRMLERAQIRAAKSGKQVQIREMDVQFLEFPDHFFDTVFATCVFCSVPDPVRGLRELHRVCKPDGKLVLLEHMRPGHRLLGPLFDAMNPLVVRISGANINRHTMQNIRAAGWKVVEEEHLWLDIVRWIVAKPL